MRWSFVFWTLLAGCTNAYDSFITTNAQTSTAAGADANASTGVGPGGMGGAPASSSSIGGMSASSGGTGGGTGASGGQGGGGGSGLCAAYTALQDDFEDGAMGAQWAPLYQPSTTTTAETGGSLVITIGDSNDQAEHYGGYTSVATHDLTDCEMHVAVSAVPTPTEPANAYFGIVPDDSNGIFFSALVGILRCRVKTNGISTTLGVPVDYDAIEHKWWRLRESAGTTYCETSPDAATWTLLGSAVTPSYVAGGFVQLGAGAYDSVSGAGVTRYDDLNPP